MVPLYHDPGMGPALGGKRTTNDSLSTQPSRNVAPEPEQQKQTLSRDTTNLLVPADLRPTGGSSFRYCHHKPTWTREDMNPQGNAADDSRCRSRSSAIPYLKTRTPSKNKGWSLSGTQREPQWQTKNGVEEGRTPGCVATIVRLLGPTFLNMPGFWLG